MEKGIFRKTAAETLFLACTGRMRHTESHDMVRYVNTEGETVIFKHFKRFKKIAKTLNRGVYGEVRTPPAMLHFYIRNAVITQLWGFFCRHL